MNRQEAPNNVGLHMTDEELKKDRQNAIMVVIAFLMGLCSGVIIRDNDLKESEGYKIVKSSELREGDTVLRIELRDASKK